MTAEIAVMNRLGVAMAADSVGSVETLHGLKTYNSNKLFTLSKRRPVGIMIYGNSALMGIPLEVIIKNYRNGLGDRSCDTLEQYAAEFFAHLDNNTYYFPPDLQVAVLERTALDYFEIITSSIDERVIEKTNQGKSATKKDIAHIVSSSIAEHLNFISGLPPLGGVPADLENNVLKKHNRLLDRAIKSRFKKLPLTDSLRNSLKALVGKLCVNDTFAISNDSSGLVIAGFGEQEFNPSVVANRIEIVIDGYLKRSDVWQVKIAWNEMPAKVMAFAQREVVTTFLQGVSPDYLKVLEEYLRVLFNTYPKTVLSPLVGLDPAVKKALIKSMKNAGDDLVTRFLQQMDVESRKNMLDPILEGVTNLPLEELALMAESLVNLTSFKRRVSTDMETVGGPIDVAVISKGDGFVWIKRKHYFDAKDNPQFINNYYKI